jgi:hypothetical protein
MANMYSVHGVKSGIFTHLKTAIAADPAANLSAYLAIHGCQTVNYQPVLFGHCYGAGRNKYPLNKQ